MFLKNSTFVENNDSMLLNRFHIRFPDEESCVTYFRKIREDIGFACPKCQSTEHKWMVGRAAFQCTKCGYHIRLTSGTVMEKSHIPLYKWFYTAHLMTSLKQVLSAKEVQQQLELKQYPPVWLMMMKFRDIMGKREHMYKLSDEVEVDEMFFPTSILGEEKMQALKRGAGSQRQTKVLVIAESKDADKILLDYLSGNIGTENVAEKVKTIAKHSSKQSVCKAVRYIKMFAIPDQKKETIDKMLCTSVEQDTVIVSDGSTSHVDLKDIFKRHDVYVEDNAHEVVTKHLPWVHIVAGECRSSIEAIHREVDERFLQLYLNEFCWKFNRRFFKDSNDSRFDLFDRLIKIAAMYTSDIKWRDYGSNSSND